jgi:hypothetical protein
MELQQVCEATLHLLSSLFAKHGTLVASAHIRSASSLKTGALQLQRVASTGSEDDDSSAVGSAILIGGPGSSLTEEHIASQATLSLPSRGTMVLPLAYGSFLVRLKVSQHACCSLWQSRVAVCVHCLADL